jgi:hypothetical protein
MMLVRDNTAGCNPDATSKRKAMVEIQHGVEWFGRE